MKHFSFPKLAFFMAVVGLPLSSISISVAPVYGQTADLFSFTDGYFKSSGEPAHLVHDGVRVDVTLGGEYYLWLDFKVNEGVATNPCSVREEQSCRIIHQIIQKNSDGGETFITGEKNGFEFRTNNSVGFSTSAISVPRATTPFENVFLVVKIVKEDKELFRKEWPVFVWG